MAQTLLTRTLPIACLVSPQAGLEVKKNRGLWDLQSTGRDRGDRGSPRGLSPVAKQERSSPSGVPAASVEQQSGRSGKVGLPSRLLQRRGWPPPGQS